MHAVAAPLLLRCLEMAVDLDLVEMEEEMVEVEALAVVEEAREMAALIEREQGETAALVEETGEAVALVALEETVALIEGLRGSVAWMEASTMVDQIMARPPLSLFPPKLVFRLRIQHRAQFHPLLQQKSRP